jgi:mono/diheme cytochrome c family protein
MPARLLLILSVLFAWPLFASAAESEGAQFFAGKVHPILKANCFECHGGHEKVKGGFRVTSGEGLRQGGDLGPALNEAQPEKSLLLRMIAYEDDEHQMPPKAKLSASEIEILRQWVAMGAPFDPALEIAGSRTARSGFVITEENRSHWAYRPITAPEIAPDGKDRNPIDVLIEARLAKAGLRKNGPAPAEQLVRRLHYNLTGLPPSLDEVESFAKAVQRDGMDRAVAAKVDELLASPAYGEQWARHWLDLVRYAETNGFERDNPKPEIWRYRDYVVSAFQSDLPYDRFIIEQLAGDELSEPTLASLTATGFHRLMQWDDEPADREQHAYDVLADNVLVTSETFLASTLGCARCHDHKIDPFSQRDYYSFMAFFHGVRPYANPGTIVPWATAEERATFATARAAKLAGAEGELRALDASIDQWLRESGRLSTQKQDVKIWFDDARGKGAEWSYLTTTPPTDWKETGFRPSGWNKGRSGFGAAGTPGAVVSTDWRKPDIWMVTSFRLDNIPEDLTLRLHHDEDVQVYLNGIEVYQATGFLSDYATIPLGKEAIGALQTGRNTVAVHCQQRGGGQYIDLSLCSGVTGFASLAEALQHGDSEFKAAARTHFGKDIVKARRELTTRIEAIRKEIPGIPINAVTEVPGEPAPLHVHLRGSAHAPGALVQPAFPSILASTDSSEPVPASVTRQQREGFSSSGRRLALAKWIASPANPLTARVMVNRIWQHHFGRGIAASTNDFGKLGEAPTHPELLDYLAQRFIDSGWSIKALQRLILTSQAAQMSSQGSSEALARDPANELFWRFNMRRLTAEEIRDSILTVTGQLHQERRGGPWTFPPLPPEVLATASRPDAAWPVSADPLDHVRRSLYIHVKRSLRHPFLADFDQADTDSPCAVRFATTVPTQALAMLNSSFTNDQAKIMGDKLRAIPGDLPAKVRRALALVTQHEPTEPELRTALQMVNRLQQEHGLNEAQSLDRLALLAINLNEFLYLD